MQRELLVWRGWGWGSRYPPHTWPVGRTRVLNSGCASVPRAGPALTPQSNQSVRQQTWSGDRGAGNSDSRLGLAGPLPPTYLLSVTLEGPHPPGDPGLPHQSLFPSPAGEKSGKAEPTTLHPGLGFPRGVNVPDPEPGARSPHPNSPQLASTPALSWACLVAHPQSSASFRLEKMFIFASASSQGNYR